MASWVFNKLCILIWIWNLRMIEGFWKVDKRDPLAKNPRAKTKTGCEARLYVKLDEGIEKFVVTDFKEKHNHDLVSPECAHMLLSQRKISATQAIELDLAAQSGLRLGHSFELMGREAGYAVVICSAGGSDIVGFGMLLLELLVAGSGSGTWVSRNMLVLYS
ncbi:hypothetical protein ACSBR1_007311 [Camellia fascicularis]